MLAFALVIVLLADPPIAGRPVDFSGAIGGPFVVETKLDSVGGTVDEPITLTLTITGPGDLSRVRRPDLKRDTEYQKRYVVDDAAERTTEAGRAFDYVLRPRSGDVMEVPRVKFVYFNPKVVPATRGWQTTYAEPLSIRVNTRSTTIRPIPAIVKEWAAQTRPIARARIDRDTNTLERRQWLDYYHLGWLLRSGGGGIAWPLWLLPPACCAIWAWRIYRHRVESSDPIRDEALAKLAGILTDPGRQVSDAVLGFFFAKSLIPSNRVTPSETGEALRSAGVNESQCSAAVSLLQACDQWRFGDPQSPTPPCVSDATALIRNWGASP